MDEQTKLWNRCAFARVCVRVDLSKRLPKGVWAQGIGGTFFQPVEYEGIPLICQNCGKVGHKVDVCKENCEQLMKTDLKNWNVKNQTNMAEAELGNVDKSVLNDPGSSNAVDSAHCEQFSVVDKDHGEWTIVTRKRRPNNSRNGGKLQGSSSKVAAPNLVPKTVWREVPKA